MSLYAFTTATFTPGGATGQNGPSLAQAQTGLTGPETAAWKNNTSFFNTTDGIQLWTVPKSGVYRVEAWGAQGGNPTSRIGGRGARMRGDVELTQGQIVRILVGQQGQIGGHSQNTSQSVTAGGGGSFVISSPYNTLSSILVIAGGGGGGANNTWTVADGRPAVITEAGNSGQQGGTTFGINGNGATGDTTGGPGAGFFGNGETPSGTPAGDTAKSFVNGGVGGRNARSWSGPEIYGGFGGGGGGGGLSAGGGGGYSGGAAGQWSSLQAGGGGGSFNSGTNQDNAGDVKTGNGEVVVTYISELPSGLRPSVTQAGQGDTVSFELTLRGASNGDLVPYTITGVTTANINGAALTGNITIVDEIGVLEVVTSSAIQPINLTLTVSTAGFTSSITLRYLVSGTQPVSGGTTNLTDVVSVGPVVEIEIASSVSRTGVFDLSNVRPLLSSVVTSTSNVSVSTATSLSQTGIFVYAAARPVLAGFSSITLGQSGSGPVIATPPATRQILIR
jgi:hypothetical protein